MRIAFIGGGTMAEAILNGVLAKKLAAPADIAVVEPVEARRTLLSQQYGVVTTDNAKTAAATGDIIVLAVKPQDLPAAMSGIKGALTANQAVLSIVAGVKIGAISSGLDHGSVIRVMPNTPAQIGAAASVWTATPEVSPERLADARNLLQAIGEEVYVASEKYVDMATGLSGSGPAYVFMFIESLTDAGVHIGLPRDTAAKLAVQTVLGSAQLVKQTGRHPAELRNMVTSPGGTTADGTLVLEGAGFRASVIAAVEAAYEKAILLGEEE
jgi:pyrroline-5-carboxylate reductase